jgi:hypothetical protein
MLMMFTLDGIKSFSLVLNAKYFGFLCCYKYYYVKLEEKGAKTRMRELKREKNAFPHMQQQQTVSSSIWKKLCVSVLQLNDAKNESPHPSCRSLLQNKSESYNSISLQRFIYPCKQ